MRKHIGFPMMVIGFALCLFSLPVNSRADTIKYSTNSPDNGTGWSPAPQTARAYELARLANFDVPIDHGKSWLMASQTTRAYGLARPVNFGDAGNEFSGMRGPASWPGTGVGRSRFGDWMPGSWNGSSDDSDADDGPSNSDPTPVSTPEPATYLLLASGFLSLIALRRFGSKVVGEL
ncbi:MAG: PEP-CTERM sorting domain-containing protein [Acidobacteriota bacterium]|nr:PEP-CTERM sorting domain-containing protein [Acidobacteriota bacterium]